MLQIEQGGAALTVDRVETGLDTADFAVPAEDILEFSASSKAGKSVDEGEVSIDNSNYQYTTGDQQVGIGDRVKFFVQTELSGGGEFGEEPFGSGPFGGGAARRVGTYRVTGRDIIDHPGAACDLTLTLTDWVFSTLAVRRVWYGGTAKPISGSEDAHVNALLREAEPDLISREALPPVTDTTDYFVRGKSAREAVDELASIAAAKTGPVVQRSYDNRLVFEPVRNIAPVQSDPFPESAFSPFSTSETDKGLVNWVRMSGGIDDHNQIDDSQTTVDYYVAPTQSNRLVTQVSVRKSELTTIELWTDSETSDEGIRVRLQSGNEDDTAPIDPENTDSDIVTGDVIKEGMTSDGWSAWNMPEHTINSPDPWLIVDSPGDNTASVGVDSNETPAFRAYFPKPVESVVEDLESQQQYGRYDGYKRRESLITEPAISDRADALLNDQGWPDTTLGPVEAITDDAHDLVVGDIIVLDRPEIGAEGEFIVVSREDAYQGTALRTDLEFKRIDNYA